MKEKVQVTKMIHANISVVIATFGGDKWFDTAKIAKSSVVAQTLLPKDSVHIHGNTLHESRNYGAERASGDWLLFLDADDELDTGYIEAMQAKIEEIDNEDYLIQPSTIYKLNGDVTKDKHLIPPRHIYDANWMVIGTLIRKDIFTAVGGFADLPIYEDWDLWIRASRQGSKFTQCEDAVYIVNENVVSRNNQDPKFQKEWYDKIKRQYVF